MKNFFALPDCEIVKFAAKDVLALSCDFLPENDKEEPLPEIPVK